MSLVRLKGTDWPRQDDHDHPEVVAVSTDHGFFQSHVAIEESHEVEAVNLVNASGDESGTHKREVRYEEAEPTEVDDDVVPALLALSNQGIHFEVVE